MGPRPACLTTPPAIHIDQSQDLLVLIRFQRAPTDQEFRQYLSDYARVLERGARFAAVFVTAPDLPMTPARHARLQGLPV